MFQRFGRYISLAVAAGVLAMQDGAALATNSYNANTPSPVRITRVLTYNGAPFFYFTVETLPSNIPSCATSTLFRAEGSTPEMTQHMLARVLNAYNLREPVNIGYDGLACPPGDPAVWVAEVG